MEELQDIEEDAGLGNGGLGRLAGELLLLPDWLLSDSDVYSAASSHAAPPPPFLPSSPPCCFLSLFPGLHGLSGSGCLWIRHPLRVRHLQPENCQRLAGVVPGGPYVLGFSVI